MTTRRECVHLVTGSYMYFRSRNKNGGHAIRSVVGVNPILYAQTHFTALRLRVIGDGILTLRGGGFVLTRRHPLRVYLLWTFFDSVTLTVTR